MCSRGGAPSAILTLITPLDRGARASKSPAARSMIRSPEQAHQSVRRVLTQTIHVTPDRQTSTVVPFQPEPRSRRSSEPAAACPRCAEYQVAWPRRIVVAGAERGLGSGTFVSTAARAALERDAPATGADAATSIAIIAINPTMIARTTNSESGGCFRVIAFPPRYPAGYGAGT